MPWESCSLCSPARAGGGALRALAPLTLLIIAPFGASGSPFLYVANNGNGSVSVIDAATNSIAKTITGLDDPSSVAITPDDKEVYVGSPGADTIWVIDTATNTVTSTFEVTVPGYGFGFAPQGMVFSPDGSRLWVTTGSQDYVVLIDTADHDGLAAIYGFDDPTGEAITPNGDYLYVVDSGQGSQAVSVLSTATRSVTQIIHGFSLPTDIAIDSTGTYGYVADHDGAVSVLDLGTNVITNTIFGFQGAGGTTIAPGGTTAYEVSSDYNAVAEFSTVTDSFLASILLSGVPNAMAITPDGNYGYITVGGNGAGAVQVIYTYNNTVVDTITGVDNPQGIALDP